MDASLFTVCIFSCAHSASLTVRLSGARIILKPVGPSPWQRRRSGSIYFAKCARRQLKRNRPAAAFLFFFFVSLLLLCHEAKIFENAAEATSFCTRPLSAERRL